MTVLFPALQQRLATVYPHCRAQLVAVEAQTVRLQQKAQQHDWRMGNKISGPATMELADVAGFCAALLALDEGEDAVTFDLHIYFLRPCDSPVLHCAARPIKTGSRLIVTEACVYDDKQALCAKADISYVRIRHGAETNDK